MDKGKPVASFKHQANRDSKFDINLENCLDNFVDIDESLQKLSKNVAQLLVPHSSSENARQDGTLEPGKSKTKKYPKLPANSTFSVRKSNIMGRYMVTNQVLKPGDVILSECPLAVGPCFGCEVMCLGCYQVLNEADQYVKCKKCGWLLCDSNCEGLNTPYGHTAIECSTLAECKSSNFLPYHDFSQLRLQFHSIMPLRCLLLKKANVPAYEALMMMESHKVIRNNIPDIWQDSQITADRIRKDWNLTCYKEDEIHDMCGILGVNAFEIGHNGIILRGIYPTACLMAHDCVANTNHVDEKVNFRLTVRAATEIQTNQLITVNYVNPLQSTARRREELLDNKYFECVCARCSDPTELNTYMGALLCPKCKIGFVLPENSLNPNSDWICNNNTTLCQGYKIYAQIVRKLIDRISEEVESFESNDIKAKEDFLQKYRNVLHPTHYLFFNVKISLSQLYGKIHGYIINDLSEEVLKRKQDICEEVLTILDIIEPGYTRIRGVTLYELHAPIMVLTTKGFEEKKINKVELRERLKRIYQYLRTSAEILKHEPESSYEYLMYCGAKKALQKIKDWEKIIGKLR